MYIYIYIYIWGMCVCVRVDEHVHVYVYLYTLMCVWDFVFPAKRTRFGWGACVASVFEYISVIIFDL